MPLPIRPAVQNSPDYPFSPIPAPIKLDQNESTQDFPAALKAIVTQRLEQAHWNRYTDLNSETLCAAIGAYEAWPASGVVVASGSNVLIALLVQLAALDARVLTVKPNFALYGLDARLLGAGLTEVDLRPDLATDTPALIAAANAPCELSAHGPLRRVGGVLFVPRPHAPSGSLMPLAEVEQLAQATPDWITVVDEAYHAFAQDSARSVLPRYPHMALLRTFSKAWGLAGVRLGYVLTSDDLARQLRKLVPPFALSSFQTLVAQVALENPAYMQARVAQVISERQRVFAALQQHPTWQVYPSHTNFLLIRTPDAAQAWQQLLAAGILVRRQDSLPTLAGCIRVTVGTPAENDAFLAAAGLRA